MNKDIERAIEELEELKYVSRDLKVEHINLAIEALEKQLKGGWIPVSERLPEKEDIYRVTVKYENFAGIYSTVRMATYENGNWNIHGSQPVILNKKVIAWRELSEPYKEVENE